jgi:hypothetical protein
MGRVVRMEYREDGSFGYGTRIDLRHRAAAAVRETSEMAEAAGSGSRY